MPNTGFQLPVGPNTSILAHDQFHVPTSPTFDVITVCGNVKMAAEKTLESLSNRLLELESIISPANHEIDTKEFVESMKNKNTKKKMKSDVNRVKEWLHF